MLTRSPLLLLSLSLLTACPPEDGGGTATESESDTGIAPTEGFSSGNVNTCNDYECPALDSCTQVGALCIVQGLPENDCWLQVERTCRLAEIGGDPSVPPGYIACEILRALHINLKSGYDPDKAYAECDAIAPVNPSKPMLAYCPMSAGCTAIRDLCIDKGLPELKCIDLVQSCVTPLADKQESDPRDAGCPALVELANSSKMNVQQIADITSECWGLCW